MKKFKDTEILTKQVYLNIEKENGDVETMSLSTVQALAEYGELEAVSVGEPNYYETATEESEDTQMPVREKSRHADKNDDGRKAGVTDVVLKA